MEYIENTDPFNDEGGVHYKDELLDGGFCEDLIHLIYRENRAYPIDVQNGTG